MREYGFRTSLLLHDAFISLPGTCSVEVDGRALRSITHSMSKPTGAAGIRAELVYIGAGDAAAFKEVEVAGRIALVDGIATEEVAHLASRAGAVGQLHISPTSISTKCAFRRSGATPRSTHAASCRQQLRQPSPGMTALYCESAVAGARRSWPRCARKSTLAGVRRPSSLPSSTGRKRVRTPLSCSCL